MHILFLLTSTVAFNVPQRRGGALQLVSIMGKRGGATHKTKKPSKKTKRARNKPLEPAGGWPDDDKILAELEQESWSVFGVKLRDVQFKQNSSPGTWSHAKRDNCTGPMAKMCAAYVMVMCFCDEMVDTSIHCAWWWWPFAPIVSFWKRYGWGCWSGAKDFGPKDSGGVRPLLISLGFIGAVGAWAPDLALGDTAKHALAMFLNCKVAVLPAGLVMVPYYGKLISANFKALNLWMPLLRTTVVCTKRGEAVCKTLGIKKAAMHFLLSGLVFLSKTCMVGAQRPTRGPSKVDAAMAWRFGTPRTTSTRRLDPRRATALFIISIRRSSATRRARSSSTCSSSSTRRSLSSMAASSTGGSRTTSRRSIIMKLRDACG